MIYLAYINRERAADLTVDPGFGSRVYAWRMYEVAHDPTSLCCWLASQTPVSELRQLFMLPRLYVSSIVNMVESVFEQPGIYGQCVFSAGRLVRARPVRVPVVRNLAGPFADAAVQRDVVDLSIVPDTPANSP